VDRGQLLIQKVYNFLSMTSQIACSTSSTMQNSTIYKDPGDDFSSSPSSSFINPPKFVEDATCTTNQALLQDDDFNTFSTTARSLIQMERDNDENDKVDNEDNRNSSQRQEQIICSNSSTPCDDTSNTIDIKAINSKIEDKGAERGKNTENESMSHNNKPTTQSNNPNQYQRYVTPQDFKLLKVVGMGAFGKVLQVRNKHTNKIHAMKVISKRLLKRKPTYIENMILEKQILMKVCSHPFIVTMHCSFQTQEKLFIIMEFARGGELFLRLGKHGFFTESTTCFYTSEIVLALEHLHGKGILHRDLKPENILLRDDGHLVLTDFGLAKDFQQWSSAATDTNEERALTVCGTYEYMAPEMVARKGYGKAADWWSLGCIAYEMLSGKPPFESLKGEGSKDLLRKICNGRIRMPSGLSREACFFVKGLLNRDASKRLGSMKKSTMFELGGVAQVKRLDFFKSIDWNLLETKEVDPPERFDHELENDEDLRHFYPE